MTMNTETSIHRLISYLYTLFAVVFCTLFFLVERIIFLAMAPAYFLLRATNLDLNIKKSSIMWLTLSSAAVFVMCVLHADLFYFSNPLVSIVSIVVFLVLLSCFATACFSLEEVPQTVNEVRRLVRIRWPERWFAERLHRDIDAYFVRLVIHHSLIMIPPFLLFVFPGKTSIFSLLYLAVAIMVIADPHEVLDHTNIHNRFFRSGHIKNSRDQMIVKLFDHYLTYILNPLCFRIPHYYHVQHLYLHHKENNGLEDNQTTIYHDRTSYFDFCKAAFKFALEFTFAHTIVIFLAKRGKVKPLKRLIGGMFLWYLFIFVLAFFNWAAALLVVLFRMFGAAYATASVFGWHGFVDIQDPDNIFRNSINILGTSDHARFSDELHIEHHISPSKHWSELSKDALANRPRYEVEDSILFKPVRRLGAVCLKALWTRRFSDISKLCVPSNNKQQDDAYLTALIECRAAPLVTQEHSKLYSFLDKSFGDVVARYLLTT